MERKQFEIRESTVAERAKNIASALEYYYDNVITDNSKVQIVPNAAINIAQVYYGILYRDVKQLIPKRVNKYKMASLTELCIMHIAPLSHPDKYIAKKLNAHFAMICAYSIIDDMHQKLESNIEHFVLNSAIEPLNDAFTEIKDQHYKWLIGKKSASYPIFSNATNWYFLHLIYQHKWQALAR